MRIETRHHYDAPPGAVHAMLADPAFWASALGGQTTACQANAIAGGVRVTADLPAPAQMRRFTGDTMRITLEATWQPLAGGKGWSGPVSLQAGKLPAAFLGASAITADGSGSTVVYSGELSVRLPLVGKAIAEQAAPQLRAVIDAQQPLGARWLADHPAA